MSHSTTHIRYPGRDPDPRSCRQIDHFRRLSRIERSNAASAPHSTLIIALPGNSMWMEPDLGGCGGAKDSRGADSLGVETETGSKAVNPEGSSVNSPRSKARRHLNT
jgi:hypothetical protein